MTTPKNAPKKARGEAERERREASLKSRELYSGYTNEALSGEVRMLALDAAEIAQHELLLVVADRLTQPFKFGGLPTLTFDPAKPLGGVERTPHLGPFTPPGAEGAS